MPLFIHSEEGGYLDPNLSFCVTQLILNESIFLSNIDRTFQKQFCISFPIYLFLFYDENLIIYYGFD